MRKKERENVCVKVKKRIRDSSSESTRKIVEKKNKIIEAKKR